MDKTRSLILDQAQIVRLTNYLSARGRSDLTIKAYGSDLRTFLKDTCLDSVPQEDFEEIAMDWLQLHRKVLAPKTTNRRLTSLKSYARWAGWGDCLAEYSAPVPAKSQPHPLPEGIAGVHRLLNETKNEKQRALIALCGLCGLRVSEALAIKPSDFNFSDMALTVRGKHDKTRVVPVSEVAWAILVKPVTRAFVNGGCEVVGLKDRFARRIISELGERAALKRHISSHDLRATFATAVYDKCLDQRVVQELLGHSAGSTTEIYIGRSTRQMREAVEDL